MTATKTVSAKSAAAAVLAAFLAWTPGARADETPDMTVFKSPWCGCCGAWVDHVRAAGFPVTVRLMEDLDRVKAMAGVPANAQSCHTALIDGYVVEGHVPADVIGRFLAAAPDARGIAVPGMPTGSPGMEGPNPVPYTVYSFAAGEVTGSFERVTP